MPDTLSLRERIAQQLDNAQLLDEDWQQQHRASVLDAILPLVEQAIREERDRAWKEVEDYWKPIVAEKDAQIADWRNAALRVGEELAQDGPTGYYAMTSEQWREWALSRLRETPAPPQTQEKV